jgi:hypothetical protein
MADHNLERESKGAEMTGREIPQGDFSLAPTVQHETADINLRPIVTTTVIIFATMFASQIALYFLYSYWGHREKAQDDIVASPIYEQRQIAPKPQLQANAAADLPPVQKEQADNLEQHKLVDPAAGVAAIPIEDAMKILAQKQALPTGPDWSLRPGERMINGVIMTPEQAAYANTTPAQTYNDKGPAAMPSGSAPAGGQPATAPGATGQTGAAGKPTPPATRSGSNMGAPAPR